MKNILIVEDDQDARELLAMIVNALGHKPFLYENPETALAEAPKQNIDLALLDLMLPVMSGLELMKALKKEASFANVPFVMVTARDQDDEVLKGYSEGADYYITKPYTKQQIAYALDLYLKK